MRYSNIVYCCTCYSCVISLQFWWISFEFTCYYYYYAGFFIYFFLDHSRGETRGRVQRKRTMRVRRTRQLKWDEVQNTVCPSRRNFAHVPLFRSLQPGKGRMAGKSRTVEVRFYKESRILGCDGIGGREGRADASWISVFRDADGKIFTGTSRTARKRDGFIYIMHSPFCYLRLCFNDCSPFIPLSYPLYFCFAFFLFLLSSGLMCPRCV